MNFPSQIERDLFDYLSPETRIEVEEFLDSLDDEAIELMTREEPVLDEDDLRDEERERRTT